MKLSSSYTYFILSILAGLVWLTGCTNKSVKRGVKIPRLSPKYSYRDKEPMGAYITYHYLGSLFKNGVSDVINKPFSKLQYEISRDQSLYIILARSVFMSKLDMESMLNYVSEGNTLFISSGIIDQKLMDTLDVDLSFNFNFFFRADEYEMEKKDTWISLAHDPATNVKKYGFFFVPFENSILSYDSSLTQVLGYNENRKPNFVAVDYGRGKFIIHTEPSAFSNYFMLTNNNKEYLEKVFSLFSPETNSVYWDNFYRVRRSMDDDFSISGFFKKHPPLYYAFLIVLVSLLLFLAFGGRRRQRFVPERIPNTNSTISYTETIGRLYLQKKDNRNIALKMFTYFLDQVRNNYYLNTQNLNNEFAASLSRKTGVPEARVKYLLQLMEDTDKAENINDIRLLELHNLIQEYFKK